MTLARAERAVEPGTWTLIGRAPDICVVVVVCPRCKEAGILGKGLYEVNANGYVRQLVVCPCKEKCGFRESIRLADWQDPDPRTI